MVHIGYNAPIPLTETGSFVPLSIYVSRLYHRSFVTLRDSKVAQALALNSCARRLSRRKPASQVQQASAEEPEMVEGAARCWRAVYRASLDVLNPRYSSRS